MKFFKKIIFEALGFLLSCPRTFKNFFVISIDIFLCLFMTWGSWFLIVNDLGFLGQAFFGLTLLSACILLPILAFYKLYNAAYRYFGIGMVLDLVKVVVAYSILFNIGILVFDFEKIPGTLRFLQPILLLGAIVSSRLSMRMLLDWHSKPPFKVIDKTVAIYGLSRYGAKIANLIADEPGISLAGVIAADDDSSGTIDQYPVIPNLGLERFLDDNKIDQLFLDQTGMTLDQKTQALHRLVESEIDVRILPSVTEMMFGSRSIQDAREINIEDLLGRSAVPPNEDLLRKKIDGRVVLVVGAGGSIGRELSKIIVGQNPISLVLVDVSEYNLYGTMTALEFFTNSRPTLTNCQIVPVLGSIQDRATIDKILDEWRPHTIFHTAAYKHVPLVEQNWREGLKNNVFGTLGLTELADHYGVADLVFISTDKAVRPTNVMGASKRICELIVQARAKGSSTCCYSVVRFGNVIASSGSVIPRFRSQIQRGGPVTVTDPEVTRYLMTIREAAELVLQSASLAKGGEIFLLDMGEPIKILDVAKQMINLSGCSYVIRDGENKNTPGSSGQFNSRAIDIIFTGLREGEKLNEELAIYPEKEWTVNPRIIKVDNLDPSDGLMDSLSALSQAVERNDFEAAMTVTSLLVEGFSTKKWFPESINLKSTTNG